MISRLGRQIQRGNVILLIRIYKLIILQVNLLSLSSSTFVHQCFASVTRAALLPTFVLLASVSNHINI